MRSASAAIWSGRTRTFQSRRKSLRFRGIGNPQRLKRPQDVGQPGKNHKQKKLQVILPRELLLFLTIKCCFKLLSIRSFPNFLFFIYFEWSLRIRMKIQNFIIVYRQLQSIGYYKESFFSVIVSSLIPILYPELEFYRHVRIISIY
jgi:hypothetical protein